MKQGPVRHAAAAWMLICSLGCSESLAAQHPAPRSLSAQVTTHAPVIDGDLSDPAWKAAPEATTFVDVQNGNPVADQTVARVLYDSKYIYVAFNCLDSKPSTISARETVRDNKYPNTYTVNNNEDNVEVSIDPFFSHRAQDISSFSVNAIGTPSAQLGGGRGSKLEWEGLWHAAARRTKTGWSAEISIPWKMLNYPVKAGPVTFGIEFRRFQLRTQILSEWSPEGPNTFLNLEGMWTGVKVPQKEFHPTVSVLPYVLAGETRGTMNLRTGADLRYAISPQMTAVGSLNPDFGDVENAVQGVQFSRTERYVAEERPFFQEGSSYLNHIHINFVGEYLYTPNMPGFIGGLKTYGKLSDLDTLGVMDAWTPGANGRNDFISRYRHDFNRSSNLAFYFGQVSQAGNNNTIGEVEQDVRHGKFEEDTQFALTGGNTAGGHSLATALNYNDKLNQASLAYVEVAPDFADIDGYIPYVDRRGLELYDVWSGDWRKGTWRGYNVSSDLNFNYHFDGRRFQRGGTTSAQFFTRADWQFGGSLDYTKFDDQTDATVGFTIARGVSDRFHQWGIILQTGLLGSRPTTFLNPLFSYRLFRHLDVAYNGEIQNRDGTVFQHVLTANYQFSPTQAVGGRVVDQTGGTNFYFFYQHSGNKGMETYIIYGDPNAPKFVNRLVVKLVFAL
ncbi:MAG: carbohydrate binding family 9 domain-containing protein [Armatimonadetes bacterium]|nr:carbohydrate binding family 9 domain-containing protein [Armatimonadota bacterium]MDE2207906.1 carbohydrate binding family 9 domain-containing protein [Armatimonadota bacterium]